jgi:hypothetical protein
MSDVQNMKFEVLNGKNTAESRETIAIQDLEKTKI